MKTFREIRGTLKEEKVGKLPYPPPMIVLKRKGFRTFPNGENIALYHNDNLDLDVSVPFSNKVNKVAVVREGSTVIKTLNRIKSGTEGAITFDNGSNAKVQPAVAKRIMDLVSQLNWSNRTKMAQKLRASPKDFKDVVDFTSDQE